MEEIAKSIYDFFDRNLYKKKNPGIESSSTLTSPNLSIATPYPNDPSVNTTNSTPTDVPVTVQEDLTTVNADIINLQYQIDNLPSSSSPINLFATRTLISDALSAGDFTKINTEALIVGYQAGTLNTFGYYDNAILFGNNAGARRLGIPNIYAPSLGEICIGAFSGYNSDHRESILIGRLSGSGIIAGKTLGGTVAIGRSTCQYSSTVGGGVFVGPYAGYNCAYDSYYNIAIGSSASATVTGDSTENIFIGHNTGNGYKGGMQAIVMGVSAGRNSVISNSICIGVRSGTDDSMNYTLPLGNPEGGSILLGNYTRSGGFINSVLLGSSPTNAIISNTMDNQFMLTPTIINIRLRGVDYVLPSVNGVGVLTNDGAGNLTWA